MEKWSSLAMMVMLVFVGTSIVYADSVYTPIGIFANDGHAEVSSGGYETSFNCSSRYDTEFFVPVEVDLDEMCQSRVISCQEQLGSANVKLLEQQNKTLALQNEKQKDSWLQSINLVQLLLLGLVWILALVMIGAVVLLARRQKPKNVEVY